MSEVLEMSPVVDEMFGCSAVEDKLSAESELQPFLSVCLKRMNFCGTSEKCRVARLFEFALEFGEGTAQMTFDVAVEGGFASLSSERNLAQATLVRGVCGGIAQAATMQLLRWCLS